MNVQASLSDSLQSRARTEPRRVLAESESLPLDLKAQIATSVITSNMKANPSVAQDAARSLLSATQGLVEQWPDDSSVLESLSYAVQLPQWGKQSSEMLALWCKGMPKVAATLYKHDSDPETPNLAPAVYWPSTVIQLTLVSKCAKAGVETKRILAEIDDPAIRLLARALQLRGEISQPQLAWLMQCKVSRKNTTTMAVCE
jgi:hypothetical protein